MLCAGILCILGDFKYDKEDKKLIKNSNELNIHTYDKPDTVNECKNEININNSSDLEINKKPSNPYDYPEDF